MRQRKVGKGLERVGYGVQPVELKLTEKKVTGSGLRLSCQDWYRDRLSFCHRGTVGVRTSVWRVPRNSGGVVVRSDTYF